MNNSTEKPLSDFCSKSIRENVSAMEYEKDHKILHHLWKTVRDNSNYNTTEKLQLAAIFRYNTGETPPNSYEFLRAFKDSRLTKDKILKEFLSISGIVERDRFINCLNLDSSCKLLSLWILDPNSKGFTRHNLTSILGRLSMSREMSLEDFELTKSVVDLELSDNSHDAEQDFLKLLNTLNLVINGMDKSKKDLQFISRLIECNLKIKKYLEMKSTVPDIDEKLLWQGWISEIITIANSPEYLKLERIDYSLFKAIFDQAFSLNKSYFGN